MGYPDTQRPGQHPGAQNYPATPGVPPQPPAPQPTREYERGPDTGAYPPPPSSPDGGYQLGYAPGAYEPAPGPPQGPVGPGGPGGPYGPGGPGGPGDGDGGSGGNRKMLWIAGGAVALVLVLAAIVAFVATSGGPKESASSTTTAVTTTAATTTKQSGISIPTALPSGMSIPPIYGGSTTGANAKKWEVEVTGTGTTQLITVGIPDTNTLGSQTLPWSKSFTSDAFVVSVTIFSPKSDMACKITRDGEVVSEEKAGSGPLICTVAG